MLFSGISEFLAKCHYPLFNSNNRYIKYKFINTLYNTLGLTNPNQLIILTTIIFLLMIFIGNFEIGEFVV